MKSFRSGLGGPLVPIVLVVCGCGGSEFHASERQPEGTPDSGAIESGGSRNSATGGTTGAGSGGRTSAGGDGGRAVTSSGGTPTTASGGTGGGVVDAGADASTDAGTGGDGTGGAGAGGDGAGGCASPTTFFPDGDGDHFGRSTGTLTACEAPPDEPWAAVGGDCDDDNDLVFPKSTTFYEDPHSTSSGNKSFDYDCSGTEDGDPTQMGAAPTCNGLLGIGCTGTGYMKTGRTGPGVNPLCGSRVIATCKTINLSCTAVASDAQVAYRCR